MINEYTLLKNEPRLYSWGCEYQITRLDIRPYSEYLPNLMMYLGG